VLDIYAPLQTGRRRCGQHDSRHLSDEARQANQLRRRLERRYRRSQTNGPINQLVWLYARASAGHDPITSRHNSTKHPVTSVPPGEQHRGCCTADRMSCTTTISALSSSRRSASSSSTRSDRARVTAGDFPGTGHSCPRHCCSQRHPSRGYYYPRLRRLFETVSDDGKSYRVGKHFANNNNNNNIHICIAPYGRNFRGAAKVHVS